MRTYISRVHAENYGVYGVRKVWRRLHRERIAVARCTVARLMRELGLEGARRGKRIRTTVRDDGHERATELLRRDFTARCNSPVLQRLVELAQYTSFAFTAHLLEAVSTPRSAPSVMPWTMRSWSPRSASTKRS
ncbi:IS3 family transposase [Streptomyces sp. NPDC000188]|uniref:IS3 family transposase n=1 Tax=Streptomyces sp. NPDC000188 TaxID=3154245 RepID=UPI00131CD7F5